MNNPVFPAFVALLALNAAAAAQTSAPAAAQPCALPAIADTVALNQLPGGDLMTVPVAINGTPKQFLLDVGTNPTQISAPAVSELGLPESTKAGEAMQLGRFNTAAARDSNQFKDFNANASMSAPIYDARFGSAGRSGAIVKRVRIGAFTLGDATGNDMQFAVSNDRELGKSKPYDGLLTNGFFRQYDIDLDFGGKKITYLTAATCADPNKVVLWPHAAIAVVPMSLSDGKIEVSVTIEGHALNAILDTSSARTVMRRDVAERLFGLKADTPDLTPEGNLRDGQDQQVYRHTFPQISFQGVVANNVPALIQANSMIHNLNKEPVLGSRAQFNAEPRIPDLTLGMDMLHQLHLYAAFGQGNLYVTAAK